MRFELLSEVLLEHFLMSFGLFVHGIKVVETNIVITLSEDHVLLRFSELGLFKLSNLTLCLFLKLVSQWHKHILSPHAKLLLSLTLLHATEEAFVLIWQFTEFFEFALHVVHDELFLFSFHAVEVEVGLIDGLFFVMEKGICTEIHKGLFKIFFSQFFRSAEGKVIFFDGVWGVLLLLKLFLCQRWVDLNNLGLKVEWHPICIPLDHRLLNISVLQASHVSQMLDHVLAHFHDLLGVAGYFFVEDAGPDEGVNLVIWIINRLAIDKEMEVEIPSDSIHVIINIFDLLGFPEDINILHLIASHAVECIDEVLSQLMSIFVLTEVPESLVYQPNMHIGDTVVNMEVIRHVHCVDKLP